MGRFSSSTGDTRYTRKRNCFRVEREYVRNTLVSQPDSDSLGRGIRNRGGGINFDEALPYLDEH